MPCGTLGAQLSPLLSVVIRTHTHTYAHANADRRIGKVVLKDWLILAHWNTDRNFPSDMWQEWTHGVFYNLNNDLVLSIVLYIYSSPSTHANILSPKLTTVLFPQNLCISTCQSLHHLTLFSFHHSSANLRYHASLSTKAAWLPENGLRHHTLSLFLSSTHAHKVWHIQRVARHVNQCLRHAGVL